MKKLKKIKLSNGAVFLVLVSIAFTTIYPFYFMVSSMFKTKDEYLVNLLGLPHNPTTHNIIMLFDKFNVFKMLFNSAFVNIISLFISTFFVSLGGLIFAKFPFKYSNKILFLIISCMMIPPILLIMPVYQMMAKMGLINNYLSLILFYIANSIPFALYLITSYYRSISNEIIESAKIDGAGLFKIYYGIMLPLAKPVILTILTLNFLWFWNEFLFSMLFLNAPAMKTLTVGVATIVGRFSTDMPLLLTGLFINCIPVIIVFFTAQRYLVKGLVAGAIK